MTPERRRARRYIATIPHVALALALEGATTGTLPETAAISLDVEALAILWPDLMQEARSRVGEQARDAARAAWSQFEHDYGITPETVDTLDDAVWDNSPPGDWHYLVEALNAAA